MIFAGIDAGSRAIKVVLIQGDTLELIASGWLDQGIRQNELAAGLLERLLEENGLKRDHIGRIVATGYGRNLIDFADTTVTEITCQALGVRRQAPEAMSVIDIGGQDSKYIRLNPKGQVQDFAMNDRCAAGTGRFLEVVAARLGLDLDGLGQMAQTSAQPAVISSMCVVFAETEIISLLAEGTPPPDIAAGVQNSIALRVSAMTGRKIPLPLVFTGGVALVPGMKNALEKTVKQPILIAPAPRITAALGAALCAAQRTNA